jgi:hypothetical protein
VTIKDANQFRPAIAAMSDDACQVH